MSAFFFGPPERQLFGYLHVPRGTAKGAAVLCAPWATEYQYAHRALHFLAKRLAASGFHVLRFDYSGTGDSWGRSTDADLDRWVGEVAQAVGELRAASGIELVDLVGLRLGAVVAARAVDEIPGVRRVVLWDPIVDGDRWLTERGAAHTGSEDEDVEVGGALVSGRFVQQFRSIRGDAFHTGSAEKVLVLLTQRDTWERDSLPEGDGVERQLMDQPAPWVEEESIWTGQVPVDAVGRIAEWLT
jgi:pimeloyl-ACP methyl ester carboxylesterase